MKKLIVMFTNLLLAAQFIQAQGIIYVSNLAQPSSGSDAVGSDSWYADEFKTGTNVGGYTLDSIQLAMTNASGTPSGFVVMVYSAIVGAGVSPGSSLGTLDGSNNPFTAGIYTYASASTLTLSPSTYYFIVLTAGTTVATGAYEWIFANTGSFNSYNPSDGWIGEGPAYSSNGSSWSSISSAYPQFAITATPIPEPSSLALLGLGGLFFTRRRK